MKHIIAPIAGSLLLLAGCGEKQSNAQSASGESTDAIQPINKESGDGTKEANAHVEKITSRVNSSLTSYFRIGKADVELYDVVGNTRRGVLLLPVIATEDLYHPTGVQLGQAEVLDRMEEKGGSKNVRFLLIGEKSPDGTWFWSEQVEENRILNNDTKPLSAFPGSVVRDSPEHHALLKSIADETQKQAEETAALEAATRAEKLPPLTELLKPGRKAIGMVGNEFFHLTVASADPSGTSWTLTASPMSKDGKTIYDGAGPVIMSYDSEKRNVIVKSMNMRGRLAIVGAAAVVRNDALFFDGARLETVQGFKFE